MNGDINVYKQINCTKIPRMVMLIVPTLGSQIRCPLTPKPKETSRSVGAPQH